MKVAAIGLDLAKHWFRVHGVDARGQTVVRRKLRRSEVLGCLKSLAPCLVGMAACATAHHRARELIALGHDVRLMPPGYVKAYVKRNKNDAADAEAICEAVTRPSIRFVPVKTADQQSVLRLHRARARADAWRMVRRRATAVGIVAPIGCHSFRATGITAYLANGGAREPAYHQALRPDPGTADVRRGRADPALAVARYNCCRCAESCKKSLNPKPQ